MTTKYRNFVVGGGVPKVDHDTLEGALAEAARLAQKEAGREVLTMEVVGRTFVQQTIIQHDMSIGLVNVRNDRGTDINIDDDGAFSICVIEHPPGVHPEEALEKELRQRFVDELINRPDVNVAMQPKFDFHAYDSVPADPIFGGPLR